MELPPLIDEVAGTARQLAQQNNNRLVVEASDDLDTLTVDPRLRVDQPTITGELAGRMHPLFACDDCSFVERLQA